MTDLSAITRNALENLETQLWRKAKERHIRGCIRLRKRALDEVPLTKQEYLDGINSEYTWLSEQISEYVSSNPEIAFTVEDLIDDNTVDDLISQHVVQRYEEVGSQFEDKSGWQPIETAPTDGTPILVYTEPYPNELSARYQVMEVTKRLNGTIETDCRAVAADPTHWMPLPSPPDAK